MVGMRDDAETAAEAIRSINHSLAAQPAVPAPEVYRLLGELKWTAHWMPQALTSLAAALTKSLDAFEIYDAAGDPADSIAACNASLQRAATLITEAGEELEKAQSAIADQGYHPSE